MQQMPKMGTIHTNMQICKVPQMKRTAATTTTTTAITNPSAPQTTKSAPTTATQAKLNDNGRKPQGRQTPIKRHALLPSPPRRTSTANHKRKTQPVHQISRQHFNPQIWTKTNKAVISQDYLKKHAVATQDNKNSNIKLDNITTTLITKYLKEIGKEIEKKHHTIKLTEKMYTSRYMDDNRNRAGNASCHNITTQLTIWQ
ncbi:hypothetical protein CHS0354_024347 [Potamilus streckersoni]|uniref:Uncharacterized protein n=1 Tax=Potamilus streckersoni TaxID=2493646 RepID=A0AAE0WF88_9BIVA|nr:hypothetical protein CHS0354_024347 [Potamilus streckersoni]